MPDAGTMPCQRRRRWNGIVPASPGVDKTNAASDNSICVINHARDNKLGIARRRPFWPRIFPQHTKHWTNVVYQYPRRKGGPAREFPLGWRIHQYAHIMLHAISSVFCAQHDRQIFLLCFGHANSTAVKTIVTMATITGAGFFWSGVECNRSHRLITPFTVCTQKNTSVRMLHHHVLRHCWWRVRPFYFKFLVSLLLI